MNDFDDWHDWYDVLRIPASASAEEIQRAFRKAALDEHGDTSNHPNAHERAILVNRAGEILRDSKAKKKFDRERDERVYGKVDVESRIEYQRMKLWYELKLKEERKLREQAERRARAAERETSPVSRKEVLLQIKLFKLEVELDRLIQAEERAQQAEAKYESLFLDFEMAVERAERAESSANRRDECRRRSHCEACPKSHSHGYSRPYKCYGRRKHCQVCLDLQDKYRGFAWL